VIDDLAGRIDVVLDGGPTQVGVESTVIDMTKRVPQILRPGGTSFEALKAALGEVILHPATFSEKRATLLRARAPGMKHRHYAPQAEMILVEGDPDKVVERIKELVAVSLADGKNWQLMKAYQAMTGMF
jgi:L-threonylcarbamoyladenylate synthase